MYPVQFFSRKTSKAEKNYSSYELEVLAVITALKNWQTYLKGVKFTIIYYYWVSKLRRW